MTKIAESAPTVTIDDCGKIKGFFETGGLLSRACVELGLDYKAVRYNLNGHSSDVKLVYAVMLKEWIFTWETQEAERRAISKRLPKTEAAEK